MKILRYIFAITLVIGVVLLLTTMRFQRRAWSSSDNIHGNWENVLLQQMYTADHFAISERGSDGQTVFSTTNRDEILEFIELVEVDEANSGNHCFCGGSLLFSFSVGGTNHVELSFHHTTALRWRDGYWPGDAELTHSSRKEILKWMRTRKIDYRDWTRLPDKDEIENYNNWIPLSIIDVLYKEHDFQRVEPLPLTAFLISLTTVIVSIIGTICYKSKTPFYIWILSFCVKLNLLVIVFMITELLLNISPSMNEAGKSILFEEMWGDSSKIWLLLKVSLLAFVVKSFIEIKQKWNANKELEPTS